MSPSSRRAWIEILPQSSIRGMVTVALLAEGVDRNIYFFCGSFDFSVALLAEGVDRNFDAHSSASLNVKSPSSRRAWIEI